MRRGISVGAVAALAMVLVSGCGTRQQTAPTGALADQLDQRVAAAVGRHEAPMVCDKVWTFGRDPATATDAGQVRIAYAWAYCHDLTDDSSELVPAAVTLADPAGVEIPSDDGFAANIERIFPPDVRDNATGLPDQAQNLTR